MKELMALIAIFAAIIGGPFFAVQAINGASCKATAEEMGRTPKYSIMTGCLVSDKGHFIPIGNLRSIND